MKPRLKNALLTSLVVAGLAAGGLAAGAALQEGMPMAKPGPEHKVLEHFVGTWDAVVQFGPSQEKGTQTTKLGMGGLWNVSDFSGSMMGMPFTGHEVLGWDADKQKFVGCWVDSTTTALTLTEGTWDEASKTMTMRSLAPDPMTGMEMTNLTKVQDADHHVFTMHAGEAGDAPMMTITYTRKK